MVEPIFNAVSRRPRLFDALVMLFWGGLSFLNTDLWEQEEMLVWSLPLTGVASLALYWRRSYPVHVFSVQAMIVLTMTAADIESSVPIALLCGTYSLSAHTPLRKNAIAAFAGFIAAGFALVVILDPTYLPDTAFITIALAAAWVIGDSLGTRRAYQQSVLERAERAEALRDSLALQAVAEERARIARELHDVVAHSMSLMVVQAGAGRKVLDKNPEAAKSALEAIESVGRNSLGEMRRILDVLRGDESQETAPQPDLAALDQLVTEFESAGLPIELTRTGTAVSLPPSLELSAFRIVQESLTNTLKHAGPANASVLLDYRPNALKIVIEDDGQAVVDQPSLNGAEYGSQKGLVGMRERVAAFGGSFTARPRLNGGYLVNAILPYPSDTDVPNSSTESSSE